MDVGTYREDVSEHQLQALVLKHIDLCKRHKDIFAFAIPNAARRSLRLGAHMKAEGLIGGVADLGIMLPEGHIAWLELKKLKGRQSISQKGFEARCKRLGHPYCCAYTFEEAVVFLTRVGALR